MKGFPKWIPGVGDKKTDTPVNTPAVTVPPPGPPAAPANTPATETDAGKNRELLLQLGKLALLGVALIVAAKLFKN